MSEVQVISLVPTMDADFPQQLVLRHRGHEITVYAGPGVAGAPRIYYHTSGAVVNQTMSHNIDEALHIHQDVQETRYRAAKFAELAERCRGFQ